MKSNRYIAYYRVSTPRQGKSGLGLEAQRKAVKDRLSGCGELISEYTEVESGGRNDRPKLSEALSACRLHRATLIIAKLDRLARNVAFVSNLMEAGIEFEAVDFPQANRLTIHILSAVAEHEARMISDRTRVALTAAKARGVKLGGWRGRAGTCNDLARARATRTDKAVRRASDLRATILEIQNSGPQSLCAVASGLNQRGITAPRGGVWRAGQVKRVLSRLATTSPRLPE
ncbi:recombinase family protein [Bradyrhizobium sp.]|uniref:recombinase family protein n=1 Tax=Bradyrhizobium sp. TaxID=376 RepID=UPI003C782E58